LSANPDFKWYKLPAPPLRTLNVRPTSTHKVQSPVSSPTHHLTESEFTPGKLADESQLGSLTSLMNNFAPTKTAKSNENNNNIEEKDGADQNYEISPKSPVNLIKTTLPPKPFKKRTFDKCPDNNNKNVVRNILQNDISEQHHDGSNMTNQDLMDKVVDKIFTKPEDFERKEVTLQSKKATTDLSKDALVPARSILTSHCLFGLYSCIQKNRLHHLNQIRHSYRFLYRLKTDFFCHFDKSYKTSYVVIFR
jgi:hypothetical protein